jgi:group I intron endonuclease
VVSLLEREQHWLDCQNPEYNILKIAGRVTGYRHSDEAKERMRQMKTGGKLSDEHKDRISISNLGKTWTEGQKEKLIGAKRSDDSRKRISESRAGMKLSDAHCKNIGNSKRGTKFSEEARENLRIAKSNMSDESKKAIRDGVANAHAKRYIVISPEGTTYEVFNVSEFSRQNNLRNGHGLSRVASGARKQYKGWLCSYAPMEAA